MDCIGPAEGVQTLSEHDALSWLQVGEADGTVGLVGVGDQVLFLCCQEVQVVSLSFLLLSLHHTEKVSGQSPNRDFFFFKHTIMTHQKQQKPVSLKWKAKQLKTAESQILLASALVVSMTVPEVLWTPLCGGVTFASPHINPFGFLVYKFNLPVLHLSNIQYN